MTRWRPGKQGRERNPGVGAVLRGLGQRRRACGGLAERGGRCRLPSPALEGWERRCSPRRFVRSGLPSLPRPAAFPGRALLSLSPLLHPFPGGRRSSPVAGLAREAAGGGGCAVPGGDGVGGLDALSRGGGTRTDRRRLLRYRPSAESSYKQMPSGKTLKSKEGELYI